MLQSRDLNAEIENDKKQVEADKELKQKLDNLLDKIQNAEPHVTNYDTFKRWIRQYNELLESYRG